MVEVHAFTPGAGQSQLLQNFELLLFFLIIIIILDLK